MGNIVKDIQEHAEKPLRYYSACFLDLIFLNHVFIKCEFFKLLYNIKSRVMKASTLIRIYDVLNSEGYKPSMKLTTTENEYGWIEVRYKDHLNINQIILSKVYTEKYLFKKLDGIQFVHSFVEK